MKEKLRLAEKQRYEALKNAFDTIEQFAVPSCNPEQFHQLGEIKEYLLKMYKPKK